MQERLTRTPTYLDRTERAMLQLCERDRSNRHIITSR
jgi:hypothetical protein